MTLGNGGPANRPLSAKLSHLADSSTAAVTMDARISSASSWFSYACKFIYKIIHLVPCLPHAKNPVEEKTPGITTGHAFLLYTFFGIKRFLICKTVVRYSF